MEPIPLIPLGDWTDAEDALSSLLEITGRIVVHRDEDGEPLLDRILDADNLVCELQKFRSVCDQYDAHR